VDIRRETEAGGGHRATSSRVPADPNVREGEGGGLTDTRSARKGEGGGLTDTRSARKANGTAVRMFFVRSDRTSRAQRR